MKKSIYIFILLAVAAGSLRAGVIPFWLDPPSRTNPNDKSNPLYQAPVQNPTATLPATVQPTMTSTCTPATLTDTFSPTDTPTAADTFTPVDSATPTETLNPAWSVTDSPTPTETLNAAFSATPTCTGSRTPTPTASFTASAGCPNPACLISRVAGDGGPYTNPPQDGSLAVLVYLDQPFGVCADTAGNVFIGETYRALVRRVDASTKIITTYAGQNYGWGPAGDGGPATAALAGQPRALRFDPAGNLYFADGFGHVVRMVDASGNISTVAGIPGVPGFSGDGGQAAAANLSVCAGLALDASGANLYIADTGNNCVRRVVLATGVISTVAGIGDPVNGGWNGDGAAASLALLNGPQGLLVDGNFLYVADTLNHRIRKVNLISNVITTVAGTGTMGAGGDGGAAVSAQLNQPWALGLDGCGTLYISDSGNNRIRRVVGGVISTLAGTGAAGGAGNNGAASACQLNTARDIFVASNGDLYLADQWNGIRKIAACGLLVTPSITLTPSNSPVYSPTSSPTAGSATATPNAFSDNFSGTLGAWTVYNAGGGTTTITGGQMVMNNGSNNALVTGGNYCGVAVEADVMVTSANFYDAGIIFGANGVSGGGNSGSFYFAAISIAGDRARLSLEHVVSGSWKHLADEMMMGVNVNSMSHLKVVAQGSSIWVYCNDMSNPAITEYDAGYACGGVGLKLDSNNGAKFDNFQVTDALGTLPPAPSTTDYSWVKGAVYCPSYAGNSVTMWKLFDAAVVDRELGYAQTYGFNLVEVYINWLDWTNDSAGLLAKFETFLTLAAARNIKVIPIFFDSAGNVGAAYTDLNPTVGFHNSIWMNSPQDNLIQSSTLYASNQASWQAYVQGMINPHLSDNRILAWEVMNEPFRTQGWTTTFTPAWTGEQNLARDGYAWAKATGTTLPVISTSGGFLGGKYSDFYTFHAEPILVGNQVPSCNILGGGDGGPEHLCTETLCRRWVDLNCIVTYFAAHPTGWIIWELMNARTQTRFQWPVESTPPNAEPTTGNNPPFQSMIYPDGHPWSITEAQSVAGNNLSTAPLFNVDYYPNTTWTSSAKTSFTPWIDFKLFDEPGQGSPDASAGVPRTNYSIRWNGKVVSPQTGTYTFYIKTDGLANLNLNGTLVVGTASGGNVEISGTYDLTSGVSVPLIVNYAHATGVANMHVYWSGPGVAKIALPGNR